MKNRLSVVLLLFFFSSTAISAQQITTYQSCITEIHQPRIDSLKELLSLQGYMLVREASMSMESDHEMPVIMQLDKGSAYHFVFIGDPTSSLCQLSMYDWKEKEILCRKQESDKADAHIINYSYAPRQSQSHFVKPLQVNDSRKTGLCGYVMLFKKSNNLSAISRKVPQ